MNQLKTKRQLIETNPQLIIEDYNNPDKTPYAHCLICSTAPENAERRYREVGSLGDSLEYLNRIKEDLKKFIESNWNNTDKGIIDGKGVLDNISIILDIHGFNVPLKNLRNEPCERLENPKNKPYDRLVEKFTRDASNQFMRDASDGKFFLFINFSWPSEPVTLSRQQFCGLFEAMPLMLLISMIAAIGAVVLAVLFESNLLYSLGLVLVGLFLCLVFLRSSVYFRDRDRAANHGVFDAIELVRWLHEILREILLEKANSLEEKELIKWEIKEPRELNLEFFGTTKLSFIAHSMGCFVATQTIRVLSDVFDPSAIEHQKTYLSDGSFGGIKTEPGYSAEAKAEERKKLHKIGKIFSLKSLILVSPDIPVFAITTGRSNFLRTCLRRFDEAYLFTNDADMVLRLASTVANYFVFPYNSRVGGYRLGNLTCTGKRSYGEIKLRAMELGVRAFTRDIKLTGKPFYSKSTVYQSFTIVDCTDYQDELVGGKSGTGSERRRLSVLTANNSVANLLNYILTAISHFPVISHFLCISQIDSHGGYFRGRFCSDLLYSLAIYGEKTTKEQVEKKVGESWEKQLNKHQIAWIQTS